MDTNGKIKRLILREYGFAIIYIALALIAILAIAGLAIDIGYMYMVKGQLQIAADAAALAGAAKLSTNSADLSQNDARNEAISFAAKNIAAGSPVILESDGSNILSDDNDITVGNWNGTVYSPGGTPVNAIQVRARRTAESPGGPVDIFLGRVIGWREMSASAIAIAARPPRVNISVAICVRTCSELVIDPGGSLLYWSPYPKEINPGYQGIAWTVFSETSQSTPSKELIEFFCGKEKDACGLSVYSDNGYKDSVARQFRCAFKNPSYDRENKTFDGSGNVTSWTVIVPVFDECPPGAQPKPYKVIKYARIRIVEVYASGGGGTNECACGAFDAPPSHGNNPNAIKIDRIECVDCPALEFLGNRAVLVK